MQAVGDDPSWGMVKLAATVVEASTMVLPFLRRIGAESMDKTYSDSLKQLCWSRNA